MKTTLHLNDQVLHPSKELAARDGITLTRFVEDALRARLAGPGARKRSFRLRLKVVTGRAPPNVDWFDRKALYELMGRE